MKLGISPVVNGFIGIMSLFLFSSRRLEVSRVELLLQVGAFCVAVGALVAGI